MTSVDYGTAELHGPDFGHEGSKDDKWARELSLKLMRYEFPLSCMLPKGISNLVVTGRCASFTHDVDKFQRNMAPTGLAGQARPLAGAGEVTRHRLPPGRPAQPSGDLPCAAS